MKKFFLLISMLLGGCVSTNYEITVPPGQQLTAITFDANNQVSYTLVPCSTNFTMESTTIHIYRDRPPLK